MGNRKWIRRAAMAVYISAVTFMAGKWAIYAAYLERGYAAAGGEFLFIPMMAWVSYKVIDDFFKISEEGEEGKHETIDNEAGAGGVHGMQDNR